MIRSMRPAWNAAESSPANIVALSATAPIFRRKQAFPASRAKGRKGIRTTRRPGYDHSMGKVLQPVTDEVLCRAATVENRHVLRIKSEGMLPFINLRSGIDVYAHWAGKTLAEERAQITGHSVALMVNRTRSNSWFPRLSRVMRKFPQHYCAPDWQRSCELRRNDRPPSTIERSMMRPPRRR
jgi:hypothetical protein